MSVFKSAILNETMKRIFADIDSLEFFELISNDYRAVRVSPDKTIELDIKIKKGPIDFKGEDPNVVIVDEAANLDLEDIL